MARLACLPCRKAHTRCDGFDPCVRCVNRNQIHICSYLNRKKREPVPSEPENPGDSKLVAELFEGTLDMDLFVSSVIEDLSN